MDMSAVAVIILCIKKDFHSGRLKLFEGNFQQGITLHIIYFSLIDIDKRTVIILFSIHLPSIHTPKNSSDESLWYLLSLHSGSQKQKRKFFI